MTGDVPLSLIHQSTGRIMFFMQEVGWPLLGIAAYFVVGFLVVCLKIRLKPREWQVGAGEEIDLLEVPFWPFSAVCCIYFAFLRLKSILRRPTGQR
jgi:hypothetical protein